MLRLLERQQQSTLHTHDLPHQLDRSHAPPPPSCKSARARPQTLLAICDPWVDYSVLGGGALCTALCDSCYPRNSSFGRLSFLHQTPRPIYARTRCRSAPNTRNIPSLTSIVMLLHGASLSLPGPPTLLFHRSPIAVFRHDGRSARPF